MVARCSAAAYDEDMLAAAAYENFRAGAVRMAVTARVEREAPASAPNPPRYLEFAAAAMVAQTVEELDDAIGEAVTEADQWTWDRPWIPIDMSFQVALGAHAAQASEALEIQRLLMGAMRFALGDVSAPSSAPISWSALLYDGATPVAFRRDMCAMLEGWVAQMVAGIAERSEEPLADPIAARLTEYIVAGVEALDRLVQAVVAARQ